MSNIFKKSRNPSNSAGRQKIKKILGIDASRSIDSIQKTGVELVSDELIKAIVETRQCLVSTDVDFVFYTPKKISWLPEANQKILKWPFKWLWTQVRLAWELLAHPPNKFFVPVHKIPLFLLMGKNAPRRVPTEFYTLIHDIAFLKNPKLYSAFQRWYLNFDLKLALKKCQKIFVPTQAVKNDLLKYVNVYVNVYVNDYVHKIIVIPHGYKTINNKQLTINNRKKQILYIGRVEEKKNISNLIKAFKIFNQKYPDYKLILAGPLSSSSPTSRRGLAEAIKSSPNIRMLGYVTGEQKQKLLQESECLVLVSKEEGFGLPILEAWDYELPVLASDIPVLQEVGGQACLFVNPDSIENIAQALEKITQDKNLQDNLIKKGSERLKNFSWQRAADKYLQEILK